MEISTSLNHTMPAELSKKQQKAQAFRAKQKGKKAAPEPEDVPEADLDEEPVAPEPEASKADKGKKRKRDDDEDKADKPKEKEVKKDKKKKTAWDEGEEGEEEEKKKSKKEIKQRFILFIGNLGFRTTKEEVRDHFKAAIDRQPSVRLLTEKQTNPKVPGKSRGIAFIELSSSAELQACLKLHHSILNNREINVELTAGGGGKSASRKEKIQERNERVGGQRERRAEREKEEAEKNGSAPPAEVEERREEEAVDGVKMRNGRRVRVKGKTDGPPAKKARNDSGWASRERPAHTGGRGPGGRKWEPTGANAMAVGK